MTYEITNMDLHLMYRNRPGPVLRHRSRNVVWPRRLADVPGIPFRGYDATVSATFRDADAANKRVEDFIGTLNSQRK